MEIRCRFLSGLLIASVFGVQFAANAQSPAIDSVKITIEQAEKQFASQNLTLLAQKYDIEASKAAIIQAKLFDNPTLYFEKNISHGEIVTAGATGETYWQLQQLFYMAGKRKKRTNIEKINEKISEYQYYDMLRTLLYQLRSSYYGLHYDLQTIKVYDSQIVSAKKIAEALDGQYQKGNISLKEITRIKALLFTLENEKLNLLSDIQDNQNTLRILTHAAVKTFYVPVVDESSIDKKSVNSINLQKLLGTADTARYDLKEYSAGMDLQQANYSYQKALAVPDLTLSTDYDKSGNFALSYQGIGIGLPIPVWNRNRGNILQAKSFVDKSKAEYEEKRNEVQSETAAAYSKALDAENLYRNFDKGFASDFNKLISGITESYEKRNTSLLEFLDYYQSYTESMSQLMQLRKNKATAVEEINFVAGTDIIK